MRRIINTKRVHLFVEHPFAGMNGRVKVACGLTWLYCHVNDDGSTTYYDEEHHKGFTNKPKDVTCKACRRTKIYNRGSRWRCANQK